jgi:hypothetical protein
MRASGKAGGETIFCDHERLFNTEGGFSGGKLAFCPIFSQVGISSIWLIPNFGVRGGAAGEGNCEENASADAGDEFHDDANESWLIAFLTEFDFPPPHTNRFMSSIVFHHRRLS